MLGCMPGWSGGNGGRRQSCGFGAGEMNEFVLLFRSVVGALVLPLLSSKLCSQIEPVALQACLSFSGRKR